MIKYIGKMLGDIPEDMDRGSDTPDAQHLFYIAEDTTKLSHSNTYIFLHFVAQLLYLSERELPDIQLSVSFLCNILRGPDTDD